MIRKALAVASKELQILLRDRGQLAVLFLMPVMFASVIGVAFGGGTPEVAVYVVNQDPGPYGAQVVEILQEIEALRLSEVETQDQADRRIADGEAFAAIVIPPDFSQKVDAHQQSTVRVIVDPAQAQYGAIVTGIVNEVVMPVIYQGEIQYGIRTILDEAGALTGADPQIRRSVEALIAGVIMMQLQETFGNPPIAVEAQDLEGIEGQVSYSAHSYTTRSYAVMFAFFIVGTIAASILTEREEGILRRLLASPIHPGSIMAGKMLAYMLVVGLQVLVVFGVGSLFFDIPLGNSPLGLLLVTVALALAAASLGMLVAAVARTRRQADGVALVLGIVLAAIGGAIAPIPREGFLHLLSQFTPHAHAIEAYLSLTTRGAGVVQILPQAGLLVGVGVAFFLVAVWRLKLLKPTPIG